MVSIRRATPADAGTIAAFNQHLAAESEDLHLDADTLAAGVGAVLADETKGFYTVAEADGEVVGQVLVTFEWSDWRNGWFWWVQSVYVRADRRRSGVFRQLFEHLTAQAATDPTVIGVRLYLETNNTPARSTYERLGMAGTPYQVMELYPLPGRAGTIGRG
jgi:GNAT superfamily N-acetyltransferase